MKLPIGITSILWCIISCFAFTPHEPVDDYATIQFEQLLIKRDDQSHARGDNSLQNIWMYVGLPGFSIAGKNVFTALEFDGIKGELYLHDAKVTSRVLQRYGLFMGITLFDSPAHSGSFMVGSGVATNFSIFNKDVFYYHFIYDHRFILSNSFSFGFGILLSYNLGEFKDPNPINLLPTIRWKITPRTTLKVAWDNLEIKQFFTERIAAVFETRYDLSFFRLNRDLTYTLETVGLGGGMDIWLVKDYYIRLRYKEIVYKNEFLKEHSEKIRFPYSDIGAGRTIRLSFVYAK